MASQSNSRKAKSLEAKAITVELSIAEKPANSNAALESAITSAELYMQALRLTDDPNERKRIDRKTKHLLAKAESIKAFQDGQPGHHINTNTSSPRSKSQSSSNRDSHPQSTRKLSTRENIIILEGSKLNGAIFKPWTTPPAKSEFERVRSDAGSDGLYSELPHLPLSSAQQNSFAGWYRPAEALAMITLTKDGAKLSNELTMVKSNGKVDLVQDMTSDCSVVASLCAGTARVERGHASIIGSILYPSSSSTPILSPNGKYILRLYFNGTWRTVTIDDLLPASSTSRVLHVIDRTQPGLLWPALIEKAYLKVRGGYDFPGSNSGTDLAVLTGWIPQQVFLHDQDEGLVDTEGLWNELYDSFEQGDMLLTIGTGKLTRREQKATRLAAEHDYAVLELRVREHDDGYDGPKVKEMLIKNPWADGDVWVGATKKRPNHPTTAAGKADHEAQSGSSGETPDDGETDLEMMPGTFWMEFNSIFHYFENMYINWNPYIFSHRQDFHFTWNVQGTPLAPNVFVDNPQFSVRSSSSCELWLLLNRHFRTGDYTHANSGKNGYISLYLFGRDGMKVLSSEGATVRGAFVDSPNTLLRFRADAEKAYTVVVVSQDFPAGKHNFTLSVFAKSAISSEESQSRYMDQASVDAAWTRNTSGGNSDSVRYLDNPQFNFPIAGSNTKTALMLRVTSDKSSPNDETNTHVKLLVLSNPSGRRITKIRPRDVVANSADYRRGSAVIETTLSRGNYTIICSTFEENQFANFRLDLYTGSRVTASTSPNTESGATASLTPIPAESSGRLSIFAPSAVLSDRGHKVIAPIIVPRVTRAIFIARPPRSVSQDRRPSASSDFLLKLSLQLGEGPYATILASSAEESNEFTSAARGLRIEDLDLNPRSFGGASLWLVLERPAGQGSGIMTGEGAVGQALLEVEVLAEERIEVGAWEAVDE